MADRDFRRNENRITIPARAIRDSPLPSSETKRSMGEQKVSKTPPEYDDKGENITATYWG